MTKILLDTQAVQKRGPEIQKLLRPISKSNTGPSFEIQASAKSIFIGMHDGSAHSSNIAEWRFSLKKINFRAAYYEKWIRIGEESWGLEKAYLHIYKYDKHEMKDNEYLLLHCDPSEPISSPHYIYKRGPHIHVSCAADPLPHAHIALNIGNLNDIMTSTEKLTLAIRQGVQMISHQILEAH